MTARDYSQLVAREICDALSRTDDRQVEMLLDMVEEAQNIFVGGAGRSGLMMQAFAMMFANPQLAAASGFERLRVRGVSGDALLKFNPDRKRGEIILLLAGRIFIKLNGRQIESDEILRDLLQGWNFADLKAAADIK